MNRREILKLFAVLVATPACTKKSATFTCTDTSGLSFEETNVRNTLSYADRSPDPQRTCVRCTQWVAPKEDGKCGGCKIMKGPIHPDGTCKSFAPRG